MSANNIPSVDQYIDILQKMLNNIRDLQRSVTTLYITPTVITANYPVLETDDWIINNKPTTICTLTLLDPVVYAGRYIKINTWQAFGVVSATANVIPQVGGAAGTAILSSIGGAGKWAILVSDGTYWNIVQSN